ncbi:MAG: DUF488 family protein [Solirubrobacterales bacterium]
MSADTMLTIGHSTHDADAFVALLRGCGVEGVADVRRFPSSRRLPHFNSGALGERLATEGIAYALLGEGLGGRRRAEPDTANAGWRVAGFRGYADHMRSAEFLSALSALEELGRERRTAFMCAEGPWWRCHRQLIADALLARGWTVEHVMPDGRLERHRLTPFAVVDGPLVIYPGGLEA